MTDLCVSLDARRLQRLLATSGQVSSASSRYGLRAAIGVRLAMLGDLENALACIEQLDRENAATITGVGRERWRPPHLAGG